MNKWTKKKALIILPIFTIVILLILVLAVQDEKGNHMNDENELEKIITKKIGKDNGSKKPRIVEMKEVELPTGHNIVLTLNAKENYSRAKEMMWEDTSNLMEALSSIEGTENILIEWLFPLQDQYGNEEDKRVMLINMSKKTRGTVKWDSFDFTKFLLIADEYFEHPALSK